MASLKLATRGSKLALAQAKIISDLLAEQGVSCEIITVRTKGDKDSSSPLNKIGGNGLFVREIEKTLLSGECDIAVHSGKDLPYELEKGLVIAGVPQCASPNDLLISSAQRKIKVIGTGSQRRINLCKKFYPEAEYKNIRGNVDTRLQKLKDGEFDGIILAKAGLERLNINLSEFEVTQFGTEEFIPAPCQGILAVECRECEKKIISLLEKISDCETAYRFRVERYMLSLLRTDCSTAVGIHAVSDSQSVKITVLLGDKRIALNGDRDKYRELCQKIRDMLYE